MRAGLPSAPRGGASGESVGDESPVETDDDEKNAGISILLLCICSTWWILSKVF